MTARHRDNYEQHQSGTGVGLPEVTEPLKSPIQNIYNYPKRPLNGRAIVSAFVGTVALLSIMAVFWCALLGYFETRQVVYGVVVFAIMGFVAAIVGTHEDKP